MNKPSAVPPTSALILLEPHPQLLHSFHLTEDQFIPHKGSVV